MSARFGHRSFIVLTDEGERRISVMGRFRWALEQMIAAGDAGCTPLHSPAPRWSHYIWRLRHDYGVPIESIEKRHGGQFPGRHVAYKLRCKVTPLPVHREAA